MLYTVFSLTLGSMGKFSLRRSWIAAAESVASRSSWPLTNGMYTSSLWLRLPVLSSQLKYSLSLIDRYLSTVWRWIPKIRAILLLL